MSLNGRSRFVFGDLLRYKTDETTRDLKGRQERKGIDIEISRIETRDSQTA